LIPRRRGVSLIPLGVAVLFTANLLISGSNQDRRHVVLVILVLGSLTALAEWAHRHPESKWAWLLLKRRGARLDVAIDSRSEGLAAARAFLKFGLLALVILAVIFVAMDAVTSSWAHTALVYIMPFPLFGAAMGIGGGLYLLVRSVARK
jgi:hypothetical protein